MLSSSSVHRGGRIVACAPRLSCRTIAIPPMSCPCGAADAQLFPTAPGFVPGGTSGESALGRVDPGRASHSPLLGSRLCCVPVPYRPCAFRRPQLGNHQGSCLRRPGAGSWAVFATLQVFAVQGGISERTRMRSAGGLGSRMSRAGLWRPGPPSLEARPGVWKATGCRSSPGGRCLKQTVHASH
jgi:hypothetical protein